MPTHPGSVLGAGLLATIMFTCTAAAPAIAAEGDVHEAMSYGTGPYRYMQVPYWGWPPGFYERDYDDSGWNSGMAPFGSGGCFPATTYWQPHSDLLARRTFTLPASYTSARVFFWIDDGVQVYLNGIDISGGIRSTFGCMGPDGLSFDAMGAAQPGTNVLVVRARDSGGHSHFDARVTYTEGPPLPVPEAGTMVLAGTGLLVLGAAALRRKP